MDFYAGGSAELGPARARGFVSYSRNYNPPNPTNKAIHFSGASTARRSLFYPIADKAPFPAYKSRSDYVAEQSPLIVAPVRTDLATIFPNQVALANRLKSQLPIPVSEVLRKYPVTSAQRSVHRAQTASVPLGEASFDDINVELFRRRRELNRSAMPRGRGYGIPSYRRQVRMENNYYRKRRAYRTGRYRATVNRAARRSYVRAGPQSRPGNIIVHPQHGFASRTMVKLSRTIFVPTGIVGDFAGGPFHAGINVYGNVLRDTFISHGIGSLYGVDVYGDVYNSYRVHASKCTVYVANGSTATAFTGIMSGIWLFLRYNRITPTADAVPASTDEAMNFPRTKKVYIPAPGLTGGQTITNYGKVSQYVKTKRVFNVPAIDEHGFEGSATADPTDIFQWSAYFGNHANATNALIAYRVMVKLTYWVEFFNRRDLGTGDFA